MRLRIHCVVVSILLYRGTTWMLTKHIEKRLDGNCTRMLQATLNKSWKQHPTKQQLYATYHPSQKPSKLDKQDMWDTAGRVRMNLKVTFSYGPLQMDAQV